MPSFVSKNGIWYPAKERAVNQETGDLYEGPDREAVKIIKEETGSEKGTLGIDVTKDPDNIMRARQLGMTVEEFLKLNVPPTEEQKKAEVAKENLVVTHTSPKPKQGVRSGRGNFGDIPA